MKHLSYLSLLALLFVSSCSHFSKPCCKNKEQSMCSKEKCDKPCCKETICKDGSCDKKPETKCTDDHCKNKTK